VESQERNWRPGKQEGLGCHAVPDRAGSAVASIVGRGQRSSPAAATWPRRAFAQCCGTDASVKTETVLKRYTTMRRGRRCAQGRYAMLMATLSFDDTPTTE